MRGVFVQRSRELRNVSCEVACIAHPVLLRLSGMGSPNRVETWQENIARLCTKSDQIFAESSDGRLPNPRNTTRTRSLERAPTWMDGFPLLRKAYSGFIRARRSASPLLPQVRILQIGHWGNEARHVLTALKRNHGATPVLSRVVRARCL